MTSSRLRFDLPAIAALAIAYYLTGTLGLRLASVHPSATALWLPTGITLAVLLGLGTRVWPGAFLGAFLVNVTTSMSVATSIGIAVGNTLEGLTGAFLVNRLAGGRRAFDRAQDVLKFAVLAGLVSTTISATIGVGSLALGGSAEWTDAEAIWLTWWLGDAASALIVSPMVLLWAAYPLVTWGWNRSVEAFLLLLGLVGIGITVFGEASPITARDSLLIVLTLPMLVWVAFRFSQRETATATFLLAATAVWGTLNRLGPVTLDSLNESLLLLQTFMGAIAIMVLALAAGVSERQRAAVNQEDALRPALSALEEKLRECTGDLAKANAALLSEIAERTRAEEVLRGSEERFRSFMNNSPTVAWLKDERGRHVYINEPFERRFNLARETVRDKTDVDLWSQDIARELRANDQLVLSSGKPLETVETVPTPDGQARVWLVHKFPYQDASGNRFVGGVAADITERKQAEDALQKSEERYRSAIAALEEGVVLQDADGVIRACNAAVERILGLSAEQIMGLTAYDPRWRAIHEDGSPFPGETHPTTVTMRTGKPCHNVVMGVHKPDGTLTWISVNTQPLTRGQRAMAYPVVASFFDITERKRAEVLRQHLLGKIMSVQEEERRRIARELHDETGQSLTSLLVGLRSLEEVPSAEAMRARVAELRGITAQVLSEVKRLALGLRPSVLDDLGLEAALRRSAEEFTQTHRVPVDVYANGLGDRRLPAPVESALYRIVQEGLTNIAKHAAATWVSVLLRSTSSDVRVIIEDNGCGFDTDSVVQSGPAGERLGLHGMRERALLLNGSIKVESAPGRGTTIYVQIPIEEGGKEDPV